MKAVICLILLVVYTAAYPFGSDPDDVGITNGKVAHDGQFPYQVFLDIHFGNSSTFCGGSLIREDVVIGATHCLMGATSVTTYMGSTTMWSGVARESERIILDQDDEHNDIAIIKLQTPYELDEYIKVIPLSPDGVVFQVGTDCVASGWGQTGPEEPPSKQLLYAYLPIQTNNGGNPVGSVIEVGGNGSNACFGDSGGPLACEYQGRSVLYGASASYADANCNTTSGYESVPYYRRYIEDTLRSL